LAIPAFYNILLYANKKNGRVHILLYSIHAKASRLWQFLPFTIFCFTGIRKTAGYTYYFIASTLRRAAFYKKQLTPQLKTAGLKTSVWRHALFLLRLHCGEQENITDGCAVCEKHYESVKTHAKTARRR